jgi:LCP family protein required for cell wall assembly
MALVVLTAFACFAAAGGLATGQWVLSQRRLITLAEPTTEHDTSVGETPVIVPGASTTLPRPAAGVTTTTVEIAEPEAANFLIAGADNGECADGTSTDTADRSDLGERSDTIMIWRANPETDQLAVLSLPRDLYVEIAGGRRARINSAYRRDDPTRLIDTINLNLGITIDHYVQIDFCAFKKLVDAVGGVTVPFEFPARDRGAGLDIPSAGCVTLDGDMALAYVRSRKYRYEDPPGSGIWKEDGTSDFGRIARQQDFLRRVVAKIIDDGLYRPSVATALVETNREFLVTDSGLTLRRMLEFASTLRTLDPASITTYRVETSTEIISGEEVEIPRIRGDNMQAILAVFRGDAALVGAPEQVFETTAPTATQPAAGDDASAGPLPTVVAEENTIGVAPDRELRCD